MEKIIFKTNQFLYKSLHGEFKEIQVGHLCADRGGCKCSLVHIHTDQL